MYDLMLKLTYLELAVPEVMTGAAAFPRKLKTSRRLCESPEVDVPGHSLLMKSSPSLLGERV